jgi:RHS repeat-associated protein
VHDRLARLEGGFALQSKDGIVHRFDKEGRLTALVDPSGNTSLLERDDGRLARVIDASGVVTDFEYDARGRIIAVHGVLGRRWLYAYSRRGDLETVTDPDGGVTTYSYDEEHRLVSIVDREGATVVRNTYDGVGRVIEQRDGAGGRWRYSYQQNVTVVTDPVGHETTYRFDDAYRTAAITDANGGTTIFSWDDADNLVGLTDPSRRAFRFTYNAGGDPTSAEGPGTAPVKFEWDDRGNLTAVVSAQGHRAEFTWDDARRPTGIRSPAGVITTITWRPDGLPECVTGGDGGTTGYRFDGAGHLISITDPLGAETAVECDAAGRPVVEAHPDGERMTFDWDRCDRLVGVTDDAGAVTRYSYDRCGRLTSITDPLGRTTGYAYGPIGLLASVTDPLGRQTTFDYDGCGRLRTRTDPEGRTVAFSYDAGGRLVRIRAGDTTAIEYGWDPAGRLVSMTDGTGSTTWELDEAGRPAVEHRPGGISLRHTYDELGRRRRLEVQHADALVGAWDYRFDADAKITTVVDQQQRSTVLEYDSAGQLAAVRHPNGVASTWTYDAAGQPVVVSHTRPQLGVLSSWVNTFDAAGNLVRSERDLGHDGDRVVGVFDYDHLGRLTSAGNGDQPNSFGWDAASNRTSARQGHSVTTTTYDAADQVLASGTLTYRYDATGSLVERAGEGQPRLACTYDGLGQVTELRAGEDVVTYQYDGLGRRVARTDRTGLTQRIYDGLSVVAELSPSRDAALETTAGLLVLHRQDSTGQYYLHADGNGNAGLVTDGAGALVARYAYSAFGSRLPLGASPELPGPLGFCGAFGVRQDAGGLLDMRARLYDPDLGRFITPDPWPAYLPDPVTLNRYLYALGDPISQVDPLGLFCWTGKNKHGKCRGLGDVAERAGDVVENVAKVAEKPLSLTSKAAAGIAVVAAGVTAICPFPCGIVSAPIATTAGNISFYTGLGASVSHCINSGVFTFDCAASAAGAAISGVSRSLFKTAVGSAGGMSSDLGRMINFGGKIFSLFRASTGEAAGRMRK